MPPLPHLHTAIPLAAVDLSLIGVLTYFFIQLVAKPLIAKKLDPTGAGFDAAVPAASTVLAGLLIALAMYAPNVYAIVTAAVLVSTGGAGLNRISKNQLPQPSKPAPVADPPAAPPVETPPTP